MTETKTPHIQSFPPIFTDHAKVLILGSMPGVKSLEEQAYYAHPRNSFWPIMEQLFTVSFQSYDEKIEFIKGQNIALWDVVSECIRPGSLDSKIDKETVIPNAIPELLGTAPKIKAVFFNGQAAAKLYKKHIGIDKAELSLITLPSTSPAHAAMSFADKLEEWKQIQSFLK